MKPEKPSTKVYRLVPRPIAAEAAPAIPLTTLAEVQQEMARVYSDVRAKKIESSRGKSMIAALEQLAGLIESVEISQRVTALERSMTDRSKSGRTLRGAHQRLAIMERVRARIEAIARRDGDEINRLDGSCPPDDLMLYLHAQEVISLVAFCNQLSVASVGHEAWVEMSYLRLTGGGEGSQLAARFAANIRQYRVLAAAFERFCEAIAIDPETLQRSIDSRPLLLMDTAIEFAQGFEGAEPSEDEILAYTEVMTRELISAGLL